MQNFTKYYIYNVFLQLYTENELERTMLIDVNKVATNQHYNISAEIMQKYYELKELNSDLTLFHQLCSWKML
jgi:hypothetical protein